MKRRAAALAAESVAPGSVDHSDWTETEESDTACIPLSVLLDEIRDGQNPEGKASGAARAEPEEDERERTGTLADTEAAEPDSSRSPDTPAPDVHADAAVDNDDSRHTDEAVSADKQVLSPEDAAAILRDLFPEEEQTVGGGETDERQ